MVASESVIAPSRNVPSSKRTPPCESTHVWCHTPRAPSQRLKLWPFIFPPSHDSWTPHEYKREMRFVPTGFPAGLNTSQSPIQKSNCEASGASHGLRGACATAPAVKNEAKAATTRLGFIGHLRRCPE
jgi:hypothetical protein